MATERALPLPNVAARWKDDWSKYPETILVEMSDGQRIQYQIRRDQPGFQERTEGQYGYGKEQMK